MAARSSGGKSSRPGPARTAGPARSRATPSRAVAVRVRARRGSQDLQALHRRRSSRVRSRGARTWSARPTARRSRTRFAARARTCATPFAPRAGRPRAGPIERAMNRGQVLYRVAELMEGRRDQFVAEVAAGGGPPRRIERATSSTGRSIAGSGTPAGPTRSPRSSARRTPSASDYFNFTIPEATGVVGVIAPERSSLLGLVSRLAPPLVAGNSVVVLASEVRPLPGDLADGGPRDLRRARRRDQRHHRPQAASSCPILAAHEDVDALDVWGVPDDLRVDVELAAADSVKRVAPPPGRRHRRPLRLAGRPRLRAARVDRRVPRDEDRLAPDRAVARRPGR